MNYLRCWLFMAAAVANLALASWVVSLPIFFAGFCMGLAVFEWMIQWQSERVKNDR